MADHSIRTEPVGTVAEETARLVEALGDWARSATTGEAAQPEHSAQPDQAAPDQADHPGRGDHAGQTAQPGGGGAPAPLTPGGMPRARLVLCRAVPARPSGLRCVVASTGVAGPVRDRVFRLGSLACGGAAGPVAEGLDEARRLLGDGAHRLGTDAVISHGARPPGRGRSAPSADPRALRRP